MHYTGVTNTAAAKTVTWSSDPKWPAFMRLRHFLVQPHVAAASSGARTGTLTFQTCLLSRGPETRKLLLNVQTSGLLEERRKKMEKDSQSKFIQLDTDLVASPIILYWTAQYTKKRTCTTAGFLSLPTSQDTIGMVESNRHEICTTPCPPFPNNLALRIHLSPGLFPVSRNASKLQSLPPSTTVSLSPYLCFRHCTYL